MRVSVDCQLGSLGLANFMWEGTGAHGGVYGNVTVRRRGELGVCTELILEEPLSIGGVLRILMISLRLIPLFWSTAWIEMTEEGTNILATVDGKLRTVSESSIRRNLKLNDEAGINEPASPLRGVSQSEACPTDSGFKADQDRANIAKTTTLPSDSTPRVTSLVADDGRMQQKLNELTALCTSLQRQHSEMVSRDDTLIKGRRLDEGDEAAERVSDDTEEMATVLTSMDAASILTSGGVQVVSTAVEVATVTVSIPTGSGVVSTASPIIPTAAPIFTTATESTPYTRRKGKEEKMVESDTPKKKLQEQIDEEAERLKRKGLRLEQESAKKLKTSEEVPKEVKSSEEVPEEKVKETMQLVPVEEVFVEALQVEHLIIDWKVHTEGQRSYWKITRLGGNSASYQFFVDMLKHFDREDLNQLPRYFHADKEGLSSEEGSGDSYDMLQTSSGELLSNGK
nr:hypothetical protein [Tanacetum cinerariifolium]